MVTITEAAATKVKSLLEDKEQSLALRLYIQGGGCSGFSYGMALDQPTENDHTFETQGIQVVISEDSLRFLEGSEVDYVDNNLGAGFKINNPNAITTCGCGSSFRTAEEAGTPGSCS